ncbi:hypothetical protein ACPCTO_08905 [Streptomyces olivoreticuli]
MPATHAHADVTVPPGFVLASLVPATEYKALTASTFLTPELLTAITLIALGRTRQQTATALGITLGALDRLLIKATTALGCRSRMPLLVHTAYGHGDYPTPGELGDPAPDLDSDEWMVLLAHSGGFTFKHLSQARKLSLFDLTDINRSLLAKLDALTPAHAVRRAWQYGLFPRESGQVTNRPVAEEGAP